MNNSIQNYNDSITLACKNLVKALHVELVSKNKIPTERFLADAINKSIREICAQNTDPLIREEIFKKLKGFGKLILTEPVLRSLVMNPTLDYYNGEDKCNLLSFEQDSFAIFGLCLDDSEACGIARKALIEKLKNQGQMVETATGKRLDKLVVINPTLPKLAVIPIERLPLDLDNEEEEHTLQAINDQNIASVIILDVEGQYANKLERLNAILADKGIERSSLPIIDLASITDNSCLTLTELDIESHIPNFIPDLTVKSLDQFKLALRYAQQRKPSNFKELFRQLEYEIEHNQTIQYQIRRALGRSVTSLKRISESLFDIPNKAPLTADRILKAGKITVIDVSDLSEDYQRHVAIYLMSLLHKHKIMMKEPGRTVLVADEAHKLFPKKAPAAEKDYFERIYQFIRDINHRGRKKQFSVLIATQHPTDVADDILALCDTKAIFEVDPNKWVREQLGELPLPKGAGQAYIICKGTPMRSLRIKTFDIMSLINGKSNGDNSTNLNGYAGKQVGYVIQRDKYPLKYKLSGAELCGYSPAPNSTLVAPGMIVVVSHQGDSVTSKLYCHVKDIYKAFEKQHFSSDFDKTQLKDRYSEEYQTHLRLLPFKEISSDGYNGAFRNFNYTNWPILLPTDSELRESLNLPDKGLLIGHAIISEQAEQIIPFFYPYHPINYERDESEWLIDRSVIVVGSQGRGKTNLLLLFAYLLVCAEPQDLATAFHNDNRSVQNES